LAVLDCHTGALGRKQVVTHSPTDENGMDIILPENDITARPLERAASHIKVTSPHCLFWLLQWENVNRLTTLNLLYVSDVSH